MTWEGTDENYNMFRWHRAGWGRYTQADPLAPGGAGHFEIIGNRQRFLKWDRRSVQQTLFATSVPEMTARLSSLPYSYAADNAIRFTDPRGLEVILCTVEAVSNVPTWTKGKDGTWSNICHYNGFCEGPSGEYVATVEFIYSPPCPGCKDVCQYAKDTVTGQRKIIKCWDKKWWWWD